MSKRITRRPRNLNALHASGVLYGGLGTSKIYVIGLAFAIAGYASFWLIAAVSLLTLLIGINYIVVCKYYPNGGGVYASVRKRSEIISLLGAFFLFADYIITAALSSLAAFLYLGVQHPGFYAIGAILLIGILNYWGPRHIGRLAFFIAFLSVLMLTILFFFSLPHVADGIKNLRFMHKGPWGDWVAFVGVILTLSGIESVASMTGVMQLDPGSSEEKPVVTKTAKKAIWFAILETVILTTFFTLVFSSINGLILEKGNVMAPNGALIRDSIFRFLGTSFIGERLGSTIGHYFGYVSSVIFGVLLLSAVNTAINGMIGLFFLMAQDDELPKRFKKLNRFGVPRLPHIVAVLLPVVILLFIDDIAKLAALYAVGFVGAIAMNLGASSTDRTLPMLLKERIFLFISALFMIAVEITLFIEKSHARVYVLSIIVVGLLLRGLAKEAKQRQQVFTLDSGVEISPFAALKKRGGVLCIVSGKGQALNLAKEKALLENLPLCFLFVREQRVMSEADFEKNADTDRVATKFFNYLHEDLKELPACFSYVVTDDPANTIARLAQKMQVSDLIIELPKCGVVARVLKGDVVRDIWEQLSADIDLIVLPV